MRRNTEEDKQVKTKKSFREADLLRSGREEEKNAYKKDQEEDIYWQRKTEKRVDGEEEEEKQVNMY